MPWGGQRAISAGSVPGAAGTDRRLVTLGPVTGHPTTPAVGFGVLGPVAAVTRLGPVVLRPRQRAVLARLLIARGRVVPVDRLIDDLWRDPPEGSLGAIRTFVADLRRALEPDRPPRRLARLLVTAPPGYALHAAPDAVDAWRFETMVEQAAPLLTTGEPAAALTRLTDALALWRGPAYAECAEQGWARAAVERLDELRMLAVERRAEALLALGRAAEAAADLHAHAEDQPLREDAWQLLATALYRSGRQGDALAALRLVRRTLAAELGVDPGPGLRRLETDILAQAPRLHPPALRALTRPGPSAVAAGGSAESRHPGTGAASTASGPAGGRDPGTGATWDASGPAAGPGTGAAQTGDEQRPFVGRDAELALAEEAAESVARRARSGLVLLSGEAGAGKTALAEALTQRLAARGWATAWGRNPEYAGAPVAWPWVQITEALAAAGRCAPTKPDTASSDHPAEDPAIVRFRLRRAAVSQLTVAAQRGPVLLVVDDLHLADEGTLDLLAALVAEPEPVSGPVLVVGTYRATEITSTLTAALARLARTEPVRVYLGGLAEPGTSALARAVVGRPLDAPTVHLIHRRTGGNPFFVRELARLLAAEGQAALLGVPAGVRDVIRHRLAQLPEPAQAVLRQAAVIGREIDPDLLAALAGDETSVLDALDQALRAGLLTEQGAGGRTRFTHILVRDTLYGDLSAVRRARWHATVGNAVERLHPHDVTALAHHFAAAGDRATALRAAHYARAAAELAERRGDPHEAARRWRQAVAAHDRAGAGDVRSRLAAVMGLGRALAVTGRLAEARRLRSAAVAAVRELDDPGLSAAVITAFDVPAVWLRNDDEQLSAAIVDAAEHALAALGQEGAGQRSRLLSTIALELRGVGTDRGHRAARDAEALARATGDPAVLALALNARFMHACRRPGLAGERAAIGAELVALATRHALVTFAVLGHLIGLQASCALADLAAADAHARAADELAARYDLPLVAVFTRWYAALRLAVQGRTAEAEAAYHAAHARLVGNEMPGMEQGLLALALLSLRLPGPATAAETGTAAGLLPAECGTWSWGPYEPWVRPLLLLSTGRRAEAAEALRALPEPPPDLLLEARLCLAARAALVLGDRTVMARLHARLLPAAGELCGAGSGLLTFGPVSRQLDDLAAALNEPTAAQPDRSMTVRESPS